METSDNGSVVEITYGVRGFYHKTINALDNHQSVRLVVNGWRGACILAAVKAYENYQDQKTAGIKKAFLFLQFCLNGLLAPGYWGLSSYARQAGGCVTHKTPHKGLTVITFDFE